MTMMPNVDPQLLRMIAAAMSTGADTGPSRMPTPSSAPGPPLSQDLLDFLSRSIERHVTQPLEQGRQGLAGMSDLWDEYGDPMLPAEWLPSAAKGALELSEGLPPNWPLPGAHTIAKGAPKVASELLAEVPVAPATLAYLAKLLQNLGRSHPKYIAAKKWFHGGSEGLEAQDIDPLGGSHEGLFGQGFYMTDEPPIARGYAKGARKKARRRGLRDAGSATYEAELSVDRVLDLEKPITDDVAEIFRNRAKWVYDEDSGIVSEAVEKALAKEGATGESVFQAFKSGISDASNDLMISTNEYVVDFQELAIALREAGYDALTHTGGLRTGSDPHQVMIMLDPNDAFSLVGRGDQIRHFKPTAHE